MLHERMLKVKNVGKPDEGKLHIRFDEEGQAYLPFTLLLAYEANIAHKISSRNTPGGYTFNAQ